MTVRKSSYRAIGSLQRDLARCRACAEAGYPLESLPVRAPFASQRAYMYGQAPGIVEGEERLPWRGRAGPTLPPLLRPHDPTISATFFFAPRAPPFPGPGTCAAAAPAAARFAPRPGWRAGAARMHACPGVSPARCRAAWSWAASVPWRDCVECLPHRTLAQMPADGIAIQVSVAIERPFPAWLRRKAWPPRIHPSQFVGPLEALPGRICPYPFPRLVPPPALPPTPFSPPHHPPTPPA